MFATSEVLHELVRTATLAPSSHNTQPWRFQVAGDTVELCLDRLRRLPVNDPRDRESTISCGAALLTLRVAAAGAGLGTTVTLLPDREAPDLMARVTVGRGQVETGLAGLRDAVAVRRTHRGRFLTGPLPPGVLDTMAAAVREEGATLRRVQPEARRLVVGLVAEGDRRQFHDPAWRRELALWLRSPHAGDGLRTNRLAAPFSRAVVSHLDLGPSTSDRDAALVWQAPELVVLTTRTDATADWLRAGQALQRALLLATGAGVATGFLNQPCQVGGLLRDRLAAAVTTTETPQLLLRLGRPRRTPPATARRDDATPVPPGGRER